ncbi:MAG: alpha/beta hydrolase [Gammaproteobacteria bacterium]|nr:alpha/beta hydrolase [Gammaproteobacteria bacterium]
MYLLISLLSVAAIAYTALLVLVYVFQAHMVYFPYPYLEASPDQANLEFEDVNFNAADGTPLHGWYLPANNALYTVLFFHGNGGNISHRLNTLSIFHRLDLNVFIFDYRGYGLSQGTPTEKGTYSDAEGAWHYLTNSRGVDPSTLLVFGRSLGAGVATWLATQRRPRALIIESAFTSVQDMGAHHYPWLPVRWLSRFHYDSLTRIGNINVPLLVIHSQDDEIVPFSLGRRLFEAARDPKDILQIQGDHNTGFLMSGQTYIQGLRRFLLSLTQTEPSGSNPSHTNPAS